MQCGRPGCNKPCYPGYNFCGRTCGQMGTTPIQSGCTRHQTCQKIAAAAANASTGHGDGAGAVIFVGNQVILGREASNGEWNIPSGGMDAKDGGCYLNCVLREVGEEVKIRLVLGKGGSFDHFFGGKNGMRYLVHHSTGIFVGKVSPGEVDINQMNRAIQRDIADPSLPREMKEMTAVMLTSVYAGGEIDASLNVTAYARSVIRKAYQL